MFESPVAGNDRFECAFNVIQTAENELRAAIRSVNILQERTTELQNQVEAYRPDAIKFVKKSQDIEAKLRHARHAEAEEVRRNRSPLGGETPLRMKESRSASRLQPLAKGG